MIEVKGPDGSINRFPDGTPDATITSVMAKTYGAPSQAVESHPAQDALDGLTAPFKAFGHEVMEGVRRKAAEEKAGPPTTAGDFLHRFGSDIMSTPRLVGAAAALPSAPAQAVTHPMAKALAAYGPAPSAPPHLRGDLTLAPARRLQGEEAVSTIENALNTSLSGARPAGNRLAQALASTTPKPPPPSALDAPSIDELRTQSGTLYDKARDSGVVVKGPTFQSFATDLKASLKAEGLNGTLQPRTTAALKEIAGTKGDVDLTQLDNLRKIASAAADTPDKADRRLARIATDKLDDFVSSLATKDVVSGDPKAASDMLGGARGLWQRQAKGQQVEDLISKAKFNAQGGVNLDGALRTQFRKLAGNPRGMARFTPEEQAAIQKVATGSPLDQTLFQLGKLAPTSPLLFITELTLGAAHPPAFLAPAVGVGAKLISNANTAKSAALASALMRRGGPP